MDCATVLHTPGNLAYTADLIQRFLPFAQACKSFNEAMRATNIDFLASKPEDNLLFFSLRSQLLKQMLTEFTTMRTKDARAAEVLTKLFESAGELDELARLVKEADRLADEILGKKEE
mgnify:CR=1 FL=1